MCKLLWRHVYMAEWLTPRTPDLVVWGSALARRFVSLNKELLFNTPVCLSSPRCINRYQQHTAGGVTMRWTSILSEEE